MRRSRMQSPSALIYREPLMIKVSRLLVKLAYSFLFIGVLYAIIWFVSAYSLRSSIKNGFLSYTQQGWEASFDEQSARISGFPFKVKASINTINLAPPPASAQAASTPWALSSEKMVFEILLLPWLFQNVEVSLPDHLSLQLGQEIFAGQGERIALTFNWLSETLPESFNIQVDAADLQGDQGNELRINQLNADMMRLENGDYAFDVVGQNISLPPIGYGLSQRLNELILRGALKHHFLEEDISKAALKAWRDRGGVVELDRFQIDYAPLFIQGNGTFALDGNLQPVATLSARIEGFFAMLDNLQRYGYIRGPDATTAKVVLGILAKTSPQGGAPAISLPLTLQDQTLFTGPVRLFRFPMIVW